KHSFMDFRMNRIHSMFEVSGRQNHRFFVEDFGWRHWWTAGGKIHGLSETHPNQVNQKHSPVPRRKGGAAQFHVVDFNSLFDILGYTLEELFFVLQLMERRLNQIHA